MVTWDALQKRGSSLMLRAFKAHTKNTRDRDGRLLVHLLNSYCWVIAYAEEIEFLGSPLHGTLSYIITIRSRQEDILDFSYTHGNS